MKSPRPELTVDLCKSLSHVDVDLVRERGNPSNSTSSRRDHDRRSYLSVPPLGCPRIVGADLLLKLYRRPHVIYSLHFEELNLNNVNSDVYMYFIKI